MRIRLGRFIDGLVRPWAEVDPAWRAWVLSEVSIRKGRIAGEDESKSLVADAVAAAKTTWPEARAGMNRLNGQVEMITFERSPHARGGTVTHLIESVNRAAFPARAGMNRSRRCSRCSGGSVPDYRKATGKALGKVARVKDVGRAMLEAFPALRKLTKLKAGKDLPLLLQFMESEAVVSTMLILMREHRIPSLSTHDGIVVPRSGIGWTKAILTQQYRKFVGVEPVLTVKPEEADYIDATEL